jgi:hypothetical protein
MAKEMFEKMVEELEKVKSMLKNSQITGKIPDIEKDIMLAKLRNIYEFLLLYHPDLVEEKPGLKKKDNVEPEKAEIEFIKNDLQTSKTEVIQEILEIKKDEPVVKSQEPVKTSTVDSNAILAEKLKTNKSFLNDVLAKYANTNDIAKKFQNSPINNIFTAIGINEKFLFIKELFNENADLYQSTIDKLNQSHGFNEAIEYIDQNFKWNFESATVHKLLELVRRRHPQIED